MTNKQQINWNAIDNLWDSISWANIEYFDEKFDKVAHRLLEILMNKLFLDEEVSIGTFQETKNGKKKSGAIVTYDQYDNVDKQLNLKLSESLNFEIELLIYDYNNELNPEKIYTKILSDEELLLIPNGLINLMMMLKIAMIV